MKLKEAIQKGVEQKRDCKLLSETAGFIQQGKTTNSGRAGGSAHRQPVPLFAAALNCHSKNHQPVQKRKSPKKASPRQGVKNDYTGRLYFSTIVPWYSSTRVPVRVRTRSTRTCTYVVLEYRYSLCNTLYCKYFFTLFFHFFTAAFLLFSCCRE